MRRFLRSRSAATNPARASTSSRDSEAGDTLVEVLIALMVLGIASVALLIAFGTTLSASAQHRDLTNYNTVLASTNAEVSALVQQNANTLFGTCASLSSYPSSSTLSANLPYAYSAQIISVSYWNGTSWASCTTGLDTAPQMITLQVTDSTTNHVYDLQVVVDNPSTIPVAAGSNLSAYKLVFVTQPSGATYNTPFANQPVVEVEDVNGNLVDSDLSPVSIALTSGPNGAVLSNCTGIESSGYITYSGCSINELGAGFQLTASEPSSAGVLPAISVPFAVTATQLDTPTITNVRPSTTTAGAINVTYTGSANAPAGQNYTVKACTDSAMSAGCVAQSNFTSGSDLANLIAGYSYFVQIDATYSTDYLPATTPASGPTLATVQLTAPGAPTLAYGSTAGALNVTFTGSSNAPAGQTYTVEACTNVVMTTGCVTNANFTSSSDLTGLAFTTGSAGGPYYVQVTANASTGYLVSAASTQSSHADTSQIGAPGTPTVTPSSTTAGVVSVTFTSSSGVTPLSYTATLCTDPGMSANCLTTTNFISGGRITGLTPGSQYYVTITAVPPSNAYVSNTSAVSAAALATVQLNTPSTPLLTYGSVAGSINVTSTSSNAPVGQTYTVEVCTDVAMSTGCATNASFTSGSDFAGLPFTTGSAGGTFYVKVTANASIGYLVSAASAVSSHADTSQVDPPGTPTIASSTTTAGALSATFSASGGQAPANYTALACTNSAMTLGCFGPAVVTSGGLVTGLSPGTPYYVTITAVPPSNAFVANTSAASTTTALATVQLNAPGTPSLTPSTTTAGAVSITFASSSNARSGQGYTVKICTNVGMTTGCNAAVSITSGAQIAGLSPGTPYWATVTAVASSGYLISPASSVSGSATATVQLNAPGTPTAAQTTTAGALLVTFTGSSGAPSGQGYTALACTNTAMTVGCFGPVPITSGGQITGLAQATSYYVTVTAAASSGYLASPPSALSAPATTTAQLIAPTFTTIAPSTTTAGDITVTFAGSSGPVPSGQTYTIRACTDAQMTASCTVSQSATPSPTVNVLVLTAGQQYYVAITAAASPGYLGVTTASSGPTLATVQLTAPGTPTVTPSTTTAGAVVVTFAGSSGPVSGSQAYTAKVCTNSSMTTGCNTAVPITSGGQVTGLSANTQYWVTVSAAASSGYLVSPASGVSNVAEAPIQLDAPGTPTVSTYFPYALNVSFAGSANAPAGQTYSATACTDQAMTQNCVTTSPFTSGGKISNLRYYTRYYVTVSAVGSSGYLSSPASPVSAGTYS